MGLVEIAGIALCAILFVIFGLYGPSKECSGECGSCTGASGCTPHNGKLP